VVPKVFRSWRNGDRPACGYAVANPLALMVAMPVDDEAQITEFVRFCVLVSLKVPVAVNCTLLSQSPKDSGRYRNRDKADPGAAQRRALRRCSHPVCCC